MESCHVLSSPTEPCANWLLADTFMTPPLRPLWTPSPASQEERTQHTEDSDITHGMNTFADGCRRSQFRMEQMLFHYSTSWSRAGFRPCASGTSVARSKSPVRL
ncbi:hypothetical protein C8Q80DRAFT_191471 [Daedaleopsis nitida]|nr:hypothetical protein C8Q80DRAFT_191471 [Daedaleopsis nitida]